MRRRRARARRKQKGGRRGKVGDRHRRSVDALADPCQPRLQTRARRASRPRQPPPAVAAAIAALRPAGALADRVSRAPRSASAATGDRGRDCRAPARWRARRPCQSRPAIAAAIAALRPAGALADRVSRPAVAAAIAALRPSGSVFACKKQKIRYAIRIERTSFESAPCQSEPDSSQKTPVRASGREGEAPLEKRCKTQPAARAGAREAIFLFFHAQPFEKSQFGQTNPNKYAWFCLDLLGFSAILLGFVWRNCARRLHRGPRRPSLCRQAFAAKPLPPSLCLVEARSARARAPMGSAACFQAARAALPHVKPSGPEPFSNEVA